jgi:glycogen synthase
MAYQTITPAYDNKIYQKYSKKMIQNKEKNKIAFCQDFGLPYDKKIPLLCITYPLTEKNNLEIVQDVMNGVLEQTIQIVVTGIGTEKYQKYLEELSEKNSKKIVIIPDSEENKRKIYAASDISLISGDSNECIKEAKNAMKYGTIPIIPEQDFVEDYDPVQEKGNAFAYKKGSPWSFFATLIRALENFRFPYDWKNIQVNAMEEE